MNISPETSNSRLELNQPHIFNPTSSSTDDSKSLAMQSTEYLEVPKQAEIFEQLYEARAPPPLTLPPHLFRTYQSNSSDEDELSVTPSTSSNSSSPVVPHAMPVELQPEVDAGFSPPAIVVWPPADETERVHRAPGLWPRNKHGRRYLAAAYVRGHSLPFAIGEEDEGASSESEYSDSALEYSGELPDRDCSDTYRSASPSSDSEEIPVVLVPSNPTEEDVMPDPRNTHLPTVGSIQVARAIIKRPLLAQLSPQKGVKSMMDICKRLSIRRRLGLLQS